MAKKKETMGDILLEHERVLLKMVDQGLQWGDILNLTRGYLEVHAPGAQEHYTAGGNPVFYYGPQKPEPNKDTENT
jgi:hypothetical protein